MTPTPPKRKNIWMPLLIIGGQMFAGGIIVLISGVFLLFFLATVPLPPQLFFWLTWGDIIIGIVLTLVSLVLLIYGIILHRRERAFDLIMASGK